jgi:cyclopropane-fatty-acyl-phospholipid synthase
MNHGHLRIITPQKEYVFPDPLHATSRNQHDDLYAELKVVNPSFWIRLALMSDLGFAEVCL